MNNLSGDSGSRWSLFNPHHKIERYTVWVCLFLACLIGGYTYSHIRIHHERVIMMQTVDSVGATSTFSKSTQTTVKLGKTYLTKNGASAYIPITFNSLDQVGIKANDYKVYVGAANGGTMTNKLKGQLIMFGSDNRAVIALHSTTKLINQPLVLYVLNKTKVATISGDSDKVITNNANEGSNQFGKFDVAAFKINPGATDVKKNRRVDSNITDAQVIYENVFARPEIDKINAKISDKKQDVKKYTNVANGIVQRLKTAGYKVPDAPAWMSDNWRPFDAIDVDTGMTASGKSAKNYDPSTVSDKDLNAVNFPDTLKNIHGGTSDTDSNGSTDSDGQTAASQQWTNLQTAWQNVETYKRDIYVKYHQELYKINQDSDSILTQTSVGNGSHFKQFSKVKEN